MAAEQKTKPTEVSAKDFLSQIPDETTRKDCFAIVELMKKITDEEPVMWGGSIVGFGKYHYKYESGHEGYSCITGFAPRKANIALYVMLASEKREEILKRLGKHKASKGCVYIKKLADVDEKILAEFIKEGVKHMREKYPS